jgi:hypothetical protein
VDCKLTLLQFEGLAVDILFLLLTSLETFEKERANINFVPISNNMTIAEKPINGDDINRIDIDVQKINNSEVLNKILQQIIESQEKTINMLTVALQEHKISMERLVLSIVQDPTKTQFWKVC